MKIQSGMLSLTFAIAPSAFPNQLKALVHSRISNWESWNRISLKSAHIFYGFDTETFVTIIFIQMSCSHLLLVWFGFLGVDPLHEFRRREIPRLTTFSRRSFALIQEPATVWRIVTVLAWKRILMRWEGACFGCFVPSIWTRCRIASRDWRPNRDGAFFYLGEGRLTRVFLASSRWRNSILRGHIWFHCGRVLALYAFFEVAQLIKLHLKSGDDASPKWNESMSRGSFGEETSTSPSSMSFSRFVFLRHHHHHRHCHRGRHNSSSSSSFASSSRSPSSLIAILYGPMWCAGDGRVSAITFQGYGGGRGRGITQDAKKSLRPPMEFQMF